MRLLQFSKKGEARLGVELENVVLDVQAALARIPDAGVAEIAQLSTVIAGGREAVAALDQYIGRLSAADIEASSVSREGLELSPCVPAPQKIICVGLNYRKHAEETNSPIPKFPILFNKFNNALAAHGDDVPLPKTSTKVDYEAELAIVIGKRAKDVSKDQALDYVLGYCNANDLSARDLQLRTAQWMLGKTCDRFAPLGPVLVTADEVGNPNQLRIRCLVNGEVRQDSNTSDMIFYCDEIVSYISQHMTLEPGDVILTGTPEGVVLGYPEDKQVYLKPDDVVTIEIEKLGALTNRMVAE